MCFCQFLSGISKGISGRGTAREVLGSVVRKEIKAILDILERELVNSILDPKEQEVKLNRLERKEIDLLARNVIAVNKVHEDLTVRQDLKAYKVFKELKVIVVNEVNVARRQEYSNVTIRSVLADWRHDMMKKCASSSIMYQRIG